MQDSEMLETLDFLRSEGFTCSFSASDGMLKCLETGKSVSPEHLTVVRVHRFEGAKDQGDQSVVYAVSDGHGLQGVIIDSYGPYADADLAECILKLNVSREPTTKQPQT